ncbi:hypothetical protein AtNW77_Chr5g0121141 [Arabidopsis thaliana]|uniref:Uncharacterized protein n=3 Tax=Arabidopsis TaxID=3701 RepID=A0A178UDL0_ARATH|nr:hypothetical protein AXX17_AT5G36660 [Arabidopsis thaliana]CAA0406274.1 unnamed protein product [Arabidopsis thaliana]VYS68696.1 unnamed protein product [Arabidopsis thaliana]
MFLFFTMRILKTQRSRGGRRTSKKFGNRRTSGGEKFSEKLQALKSLLPPPSKMTEQSRQDAYVEEDSSVGETEQLFQETADYIVRLRTQVVVLQKLIEIYGSSDQKEDNFVS